MCTLRNKETKWGARQRKRVSVGRKRELAGLHRRPLSLWVDQVLMSSLCESQAPRPHCSPQTLAGQAGMSQNAGMKNKKK